MGADYKPGLTLDRVDNEGGYSKENCAWVTMKDQANNKRTTREIETPWGPMTAAKAAEVSGIKKTTLYYRLKYCPQEAWFAEVDVRNRFTTS
jgi:hypothetical protein